MSVVIAFHCWDGSVVATDSAITHTLGDLVTTQSHGNKISILPNRCIVAWSGDISHGSRLVERLKQFRRKFSNHVAHSVWLRDHVIEHFSVSGKLPLNLEFVVSGSDDHEHFTYCFTGNDLKTEILGVCRPWATLGHGKQYVDPFLKYQLNLKIFNKGGLSVRNAIGIVALAMSYAVETSDLGIDSPIRIGVISASHRYTPMMVQADTVEEFIGDFKTSLCKWYTNSVFFGEAFKEFEPVTAEFLKYLDGVK